MDDEQARDVQRAFLDGIEKMQDGQRDVLAAADQLESQGYDVAEYRCSANYWHDDEGGEAEPPAPLDDAGTTPDLDDFFRGFRWSVWQRAGRGFCVGDT